MRYGETSASRRIKGEFVAPGPVDRASLESELGPTFRYGEQTVWCSQCLDPCAGLNRIEGDPRIESQHNVERADKG